MIRVALAALAFASGFVAGAAEAIAVHNAPRLAGKGGTK